VTGSRIPATSIVARRKIARRGKAGRFDPILWLILASFAVWEFVAHFLLHNDSGHTLSDRIRAFEKWSGWPGYVTVAALIPAIAVVLELHLVSMAF
jgi:hypothetical protein